MNLDEKVSEYISNAPEEFMEILEVLRGMVHESVPGVTEAIKWRMPVFSKEKNFAYLRMNKKHITLGFYHPERLEDPEGILEGTGKELRHVKIKTERDILPEHFTRWLQAAAG